MNKNEKVLLAAIMVCTGVAGYFTGKLTIPAPLQEAKEASNYQDIAEMRGGGNYQFINPLLECDNYQPSQLNSVVTMEQDVRNYIQQVKDQQKASFISVYFRDLNFGPWMGVNEKENFSPASLLKVPIMIAALRQAEQDPGFLKKKLAYTQHLDMNAVPNITDPNLLKIGTSYTVENLIERMIEFSDNEAKELLLRNLNESFILKVMTDIGINVSGNMGADFVSVKDYSGFFRLLYNATYLSREMSEKALQILSKTSYSRGIMGGLPQGITVSHKFGERAYSDSNIKQLHECGIVYMNKSPYLVCIMTRGTDFKQLESVISAISGIVYKNASAAQQK